MNKWVLYKNDFRNYLRLEKNLSENTIEGYMNDIVRLIGYMDLKYNKTHIKKLNINHLREYLIWLMELGITPRSQARNISSIKAFFMFLIYNQIIEENPTVLLEAPKLGKYLPVVLTVEEINAMAESIDLSQPTGHRDKAIIEVLYGCGLRVSELTGLRLTNIFSKEGYIKVQGKGSKERLVPISPIALKELNHYITHARNQVDIKREYENYIFLNRFGKSLSRISIFTMVKKLAADAGIKKNISPHTFRHSFASHLIEGGADLRAVQEMLGHESILTTEIYTHIDRDYLKQTIIEHHPRK